MDAVGKQYFQVASCCCCSSQNFKIIFPIDKAYIENMTNVDMSEINVGVAQCHDCRHEFIAPSPTPVFLSIFYSAYMSEAKSGFYKERVSEDIPVDFRQRYTPWLDIARDLVSKNKQLLDVGAGLGMFLRLASQSGFAVHGVEPNAESAEAIKERLGVEVENSLFENANILKRFNVITMWDLLEHMATPREGLEKANALLNADGVLVLEIPARDSLLHKLAKGLHRLSFGMIRRPLYLVCGIHHLNYFDEKSVRKLLNETGFSVIKVYRGETEINSLLKNGKGLVQRTKCYLYNSTLALVFFVARLVGRKNKLIVFAKKSN